MAQEHMVDVRFQEVAIEALQEASEAFLVGFFNGRWMMILFWFSCLFRFSLFWIIILMFLCRYFDFDFH